MPRSVQVYIFLDPYHSSLSKCSHIAWYVIRKDVFVSAVDILNERTNPDFTLKQKTKNESGIAKDTLVSILSCLSLFSGAVFGISTFIFVCLFLSYQDPSTWVDQKDHHQDELWTRVVVNRLAGGVKMQTLNQHSKALIACGSITVEAMRLQHRHNQMETIILLVV